MATARPAPPPPPVRRPASGRSVDPPGAASLGRLLREADKDMVRLQRQRDRITEALTRAEGHQEMTRMGAELAEAQRALDEVEERWLSLAEEAESRR